MLVKSLLRAFSSSLLTPAEVSSLLPEVRKHTLLESLYIYPYYDHYYGYLLLDKSTKQLMAIDCGDYKQCRFNVERIMKLEGASFTHLFLTHEHERHCSGVAEWLQVHPGLQVISSRYAQPKVQFSTLVGEGEAIQVGTFRVLPLCTQGHSPGSITYIVTELSPESTKSPIVFTGDTLMVGGCGKVNDVQDMFESLELLRKLPDKALIFPGHEHALESLLFAKLLDPANDYLSEKLAWAKQRRSQHDSAIGTMVCEERLYNPFLRYDHPHYLRLTDTTDPQQSFQRLWELFHQLVIA